jgi:hypothetical protein
MANGHVLQHMAQASPLCAPGPRVLAFLGTAEREWGKDSAKIVRRTNDRVVHLHLRLA